MPKRGLLNRNLIFAFLAFFAPFALYFLTTCRDIYWLDSAEFALATRTGGLVHPPGYPLLLNLLSFVSLLPVFTLPFRINLLSALVAAGSCFFLFHIINRLTGDEKFALLGAFIWALSFELWQQATAIEVYALQVFLFALTLWALLRWRETSSASYSYLYFFGFSFGLTLANHLFIIVWIPTFLILLHTPALKNLHRRQWLLFFLLLLLGPLLYLSLLFRSQNPPGWAGIESTDDFFRYITAAVYRYRFLAGGTDYLTQQVSSLPLTLFKQFTIFWLLLIPGSIWLIRKNKRLFFALLIGTVLASSAALLYNIPDKEGYFLPVYFCLAIFIGSAAPHFQAKKGRTGIFALIIIALIVVVLGNYPRQNRSHLTALSDLARAVCNELPAHAVIFTDDYSLFQGLNWHNIIEKPDNLPTIISEHHLVFPWYLKQLAKTVPVPDPCFDLARTLWENRTRLSKIQFGTLASERAQEIKRHLLLSLTDHPCFYFPQNFSQSLERWQNFRLRLHGLTYQFRPLEDSTIEPEIKFTFPEPERYSTNKFYDPYAEDLCRRFAATANRRGMLRYASGDDTGAIADFNLALKYYPDYSAAIENKGLVFAMTGKTDSARFYLTKFIKLEPNSPEINKVRVFLNKLND